MIVEKILKQVTPERAKRELEAIKKAKLPLEIQKWVDEYEKVGERDGFIWKWFFEIEKEISCVSNRNIYRKSVREIKFLITMFVILLDDVADQNKNKKLLIELLKIPFEEDYIQLGKLNIKEKKYLEFSVKVWHKINRLIKKLPKHKEYIEIFKYDISQIINAIKYDILLSNNYYLINKAEYWLYSPHAMQFMTFVTVELMSMLSFDIRELGIIREFGWQVQKMARVGNCVSTWEREIKDNDFTSGVFAYAINSEVILAQELEKINDIKIIKKIKKSNIENELLVEWENCYKEVSSFKRVMKTVNIQNFLCGLEKLFMLEIISKRYK